MLDVLIRNARVCDGSGGKSFTADVGVRDGTIAAVGRSDEPARRTVDAAGLALMPGIVDVHTHYDAQITWDATLSPSVALGVTTVVMGNCGFGIAPCPPPLRETLLRNLSAVVGMHVDALLAGTRWGFESFAPYLAQPERALEMYERCAQAKARGHEVYIHANCQPLSFDFTLREPYLLYSHDAFDRVKAAAPEARGAIYREQGFRDRLRYNFLHPKQGILFYGDWSQVERDGVAVSELAKREGKDALDYVFDLPLEVQLVAKLYQNDDAGVAPLLKHPAGLIALSDGGRHPIHFCHACSGLHFLAHWVRDTETFTLEEGVRRLTSDPARKYRIPKRGLIAPGYHADLLLFEPRRVGVSKLRRVNDLPGGGARMLRDPEGVRGVWVNGVEVFDGMCYTALDSGPGGVLRRFER